MLRFLIAPAVFAVVAYATLSGADLSDTVKFALILIIALTAVAIYAWAARAKRLSDNPGEHKP